MRILGAIFSTRAQRAHDRYMREIEAVERVTVAALETARAEDLAEQLAAANAKLLDVSESLEDMKAEANRHSEEAAAARLRNADLQRRLDATLQALDKARAEQADTKSQLSATESGYEILLEEGRKNAASAKEARRIAGLSLKQLETYQDAVKMLVERGALSAVEVAQLNLGTFIPANADAGLPPSIEFGDVTEGKTSIDFGMKSQATEAKYRQTKEHFQRYQSAVGVMLDRLNDLGKANHVTKEDLRKLRQLREDLSAQIKRTI